MGKKLPDLTSAARARPYIAQLALQSDRACGIVAGAILEALLERILRRRFVRGTDEDLFVTYGPLSSFAAKINAAAAMGLITKAEQRELHCIRRIRNDFAHDLDRAAFTSEPTKTHVRQLSLTRSRLTALATSPRVDFESAVMVLVGFLNGRTQRTRRIKTPRDHAQHLIDMHSQTKRSGTVASHLGEPPNKRIERTRKTRRSS
jgi:DNA-binding MltR family transcriptional regulator